MRLVLFFIFFAKVSIAFERKQEQFPTAFSYLLVPAPYQIPGLGSGWVLWSSVNNFVFNYMDIFAYKFTGAADGYGVGLKDIHIIPEYLFFRMGTERVKNATIQQFNYRGMNNASDEFNYMSATNISENYALAELTFWNRRINFFYKSYIQEFEVEDFSNKDTDEILNFDISPNIKNKNISQGILLDLTNDFLDPTIGIRIGLSKTSIDTDSIFSDSKYHVIDQAYNLYIPIGAYSTLAFHYSKSDAYVGAEGTVNASDIENKLNLKNCANLGSNKQEVECESAKSKLLERISKQNQHGAATSLGGSSRLRGYPMERFSGSHMRFFGTEVRWNLDAGVVPFDLFLIRDTRSAFQLAFFYEKGTIGDDEEEMSTHWRDAKGVGLRVVTKSGYVFRLDYGTSDEGTEVTLLGSYPW